MKANKTRAIFLTTALFAVFFLGSCASCSGMNAGTSDSTCAVDGANDLIGHEHSGLSIS